MRGKQKELMNKENKKKTEKQNMREQVFKEVQKDSEKKRLVKGCTWASCRWKINTKESFVLEK